MTQYIDGNWVSGTGETFVSTDPSNGDTLWKGAEATQEQIDAAVKSARIAFQTWGFLPFDDRLAILQAYADKLAAHKDTLAKLIAADAGKTLWDATGEAGAMIGKIAISVQAYRERTGEKSSAMGAFEARLAHRPHGVMAVFGPYNFPGHLPNGHIVPALLAGNTVVFKPSELTPAVAEKMVEIWAEAGLPAGVLNLVQGGRSVGEALVANTDIDGVLFTGSVRAGQAIARALVDRPNVIQALELGGNNPLIVADVKDHRAAALMVINSAFISSGQRCTCARRLIVPDTQDGDDFIETLADMMDGITVGAWSDEDQSYMGPLISEHAARLVIAAYDALINNGGEMIRPVKPLARGAAFVTPGLVDVTDVTSRPDEEVFGPLLQVIRVADFDAAIAEANNTAFGLASGLISDNRALYDRYFPRARAGIVNWNQQLTGAASSAPFGGIGLSGNHRPSAYYAADYCSYAVASINGGAGVCEMPATPVGLNVGE